MRRWLADQPTSWPRTRHLRCQTRNSDEALWFSLLSHLESAVDLDLSPARGRRLLRHQDGRRRGRERRLLTGLRERRRRVLPRGASGLPAPRRPHVSRSSSIGPPRPRMTPTRSTRSTSRWTTRRGTATFHGRSQPGLRTRVRTRTSSPRSAEHGERRRRRSAREPGALGRGRALARQERALRPRRLPCRPQRHPSLRARRDRRGGWCASCSTSSATSAPTRSRGRGMAPGSSGLDFSERSLDRRRASSPPSIGIEAEFWCADVYDAVDAVGRADVRHRLHRHRRARVAARPGRVGAVVHDLLPPGRDPLPRRDPPRGRARSSATGGRSRRTACTRSTARGTRRAARTRRPTQPSSTR